MEAKVKQVTTIELHLTKEEANWLKGLMQNPYPDHPGEIECSYSNKMRMAFWNALGGDGQ